MEKESQRRAREEQAKKTADAVEARHRREKEEAERAAEREAREEEMRRRAAEARAQKDSEHAAKLKLAEEAAAKELAHRAEIEAGIIAASADAKKAADKINLKEKRIQAALAVWEEAQARTEVSSMKEAMGRHAEACGTCHGAFGLMRWRKRCGRCGETFCITHCGHERKMPAHLGGQVVGCCGGCDEALTQAPRRLKAVRKQIESDIEKEEEENRACMSGMVAPPGSTLLRMVGSSPREGSSKKLAGSNKGPPSMGTQLEDAPPPLFGLKPKEESGILGGALPGFTPVKDRRIGASRVTGGLVLPGGDKASISEYVGEESESMPLPGEYKRNLSSAVGSRAGLDLPSLSNEDDVGSLSRASSGDSNASATLPMWGKHLTGSKPLHSTSPISSGASDEHRSNPLPSWQNPAGSKLGRGVGSQGIQQGKRGGLNWMASKPDSEEGRVIGAPPVNDGLDDLSVSEIKTRLKAHGLPYDDLPPEKHAFVQRLRSIENAQGELDEAMGVGGPSGGDADNAPLPGAFFTGQRGNPQRRDSGAGSPLSAWGAR